MGFRKPAPRDQVDSPFSEILGSFWRAHPSVLAATFVDSEGECVDYFSSIEPFEAKVAGAHLVATHAMLRDHLERAGLGEPRVWIVEAEHRDLVMARASDEYVIVLILKAKGLTARMLLAIEALIEALGREAGLQLELPLHVDVDAGRDADGSVLPLGLRTGSETVPVIQVLARWSETGSLAEGQLFCFRALTPDGELTLIYDTSLHSWRIRPVARDSQRPRRPSRSE